MKFVALFSGQGAQKIGMAKDLYDSQPFAKELFKKANEILGFDITKIMFNGPVEELTKTSCCQPALFIHGILLYNYLKDNYPHININACAGLSLGEFTAYSVAGAFNYEVGLKIVSERGKYMEIDANQTKGAMLAVIGGKENDVEKFAKEMGVEVANYNAPGQLVLSGQNNSIDLCLKNYKQSGAKLAKKLEVSGAYHSKYMLNAQENLQSLIKSTPINMPTKSVVSNYLAKECQNVHEIKESLVKQVSGSVRWYQSINYYIEKGYDNFIELGPNNILSGLMKRINRKVNIISIESINDFEKLEKL